MRRCRGTLDKVKDKRSKSMRQILQSVSEAYSAKKVILLNIFIDFLLIHPIKKVLIKPVLLYQ